MVEGEQENGRGKRGFGSLYLLLKAEKQNFFCVVLLLSHCLWSHPLLFNLRNIPRSILSFPDRSPGLGREGSEGLLCEPREDKQSKLAVQLVAVDSSSGAR